MKNRILISSFAGAIIVGGVGLFSLLTFNVSAMVPHWDITTTLLGAVKDQSIHSRAGDVVLTDLDLSDEMLITRGALQFNEMCVQCHLAPDKAESEIHKGLYPKPPLLHDMEHPVHDPRETFWVIKNGIKMTGMPAWGPSHDDETIWSLVAFIQRLDGMSAEEYEAYQKKAHKMGIPHGHD